MKNRWKLLTSIICILLLLSACSYREFEDSMKNKLNNKEDEEYINPAKIPDESSNTENPDTPKSSEQNLYTIGDTITFTYGAGGTVQYTLEQVELTDNINELDLNRADFYDTSLISENGDINSEYSLLTIGVTVKNIDINELDEDIDGNSPVLFIEPSIGFKSGIEDPNGPFSFDASYFSENRPNNQYYYFFPLKVGNEIDVVIGWFVPKEGLLEETLYYIIGYPGSFEDYEYFKLDLELGEN